MKNSTRAFIQDLERKGIRHSLERVGTNDETDAISIQYEGENMKQIRVLLFFSETDVCYKIFSIAKVPDIKMEEALEKINELHNKWRWLTFAIDEDNEIWAELDLFYSEKDIDIYTDGLVQIIDITDKCYPEFMKLIWS